MAITTISRMQQRRGLYADLPVSLAEGEFGWCLDTRQLFIGNSPGYGDNTEILTEHGPNTEVITNRWRTYSETIADAIARPLGEKLNDAASVKDFGAKGDGVTDDAPAINAAIAALLTSANTTTTATNTSTRVILRFPAGFYTIGSPILLYPFVSLIGDGIDKTRIILRSGYADTCVMKTADSEGNTGVNIGTGSAFRPQRIVVADMTLDTNSQSKTAVELVRYTNTRFENVRFRGNYVTSNGTGNVHKAVILQSLGTAFDTFDAQFVKCIFNNFNTGIYSSEQIYFTTISRCEFRNVYQGIVFDDLSPGNGPGYTAVSQCMFRTTYGSGIVNNASNPGISSSANLFKYVGFLGTEPPIQFNALSNYNSSTGDIFDPGNLPGVVDYGSNNLIFNAGQLQLGNPLRLATLTTVQRNALTPLNGYLIYNTTANRFQGYQNGGWINLDDGSPA